MKKAIIISAIVLSAGAVGYFVVYPTIKRHNIRKRLDEAYRDPAGYNAAGGMDKMLITEVFNPDKYSAQSNKATITLMEARERAEIIWDNYSSWLSSNQTAIIGAFNGLGHADDVSKISHEFYALYDEDLLQVIKDAVSDKAQYNLLIGKINKLPKN